jgi:hypothetical protein
VAEASCLPSIPAVKVIVSIAIAADKLTDLRGAVPKLRAADNLIAGNDSVANTNTEDSDTDFSGAADIAITGDSETAITHQPL